MSLHDKILALPVMKSDDRLVSRDSFILGAIDMRNKAAKLAVQQDAALEKALSERDEAEHVAGRQLTAIEKLEGQVGARQAECEALLFDKAVLLIAIKDASELCFMGFSDSAYARLVTSLNHERSKE